MTKKCEKKIDIVCEQIVCKTKEYNFVEKLGTKLCGNHGKKKVFFLENCVEKLVGRVGWEDLAKGLVENVFEDCVEQYNLQLCKKNV